MIITVPPDLLAKARRRNAATRRKVRKMIRHRLVVEPALAASAARQGVTLPPPEPTPIPVLDDRQRALVAAALRRTRVQDLGRQLAADLARFHRTRDELFAAVRPHVAQRRALWQRVHPGTPPPDTRRRS